ncbi:TRP C-terminal domain-containing protein [Plasmodiophora brassicae]|uniref:Uncharacterized protein n=1 Tax=Plasmodiophora brassicae TaxID=37360 RepID=A0A0G4J7F6_PLABS|nr:hypothetical protein PBRA_009434 [Plasmodiophora brassicae]
MCLLPMGGGAPQLLISPSDRAKLLAQRLRVVIPVHIVVLIVTCFAGDILYSLITMAVSLCAFFAIRNPEGYEVQKLPCYTLISAIQVFTSIVNTALAGVGAAPFDKAAQSTISLALVVFPLSVIVGTAAAFISNQLYDELRHLFGVNGLSSVFMGGDDGPGGGNSGMFQQQQQAQAYPAPGPSEPPAYQPRGGAAPPGFKPFSGQGHRLDGKK